MAFAPRHQTARPRNAAACRLPSRAIRSACPARRCPAHWDAPTGGAVRPSPAHAPRRHNRRPPLCDTRPSPGGYRDGSNRVEVGGLLHLDGESSIAEMPHPAIAAAAVRILMDPDDSFVGLRRVGRPGKECRRHQPCERPAGHHMCAFLHLRLPFSHRWTARSEGRGHQRGPAWPSYINVIGFSPFMYPVRISSMRKPFRVKTSAMSRLR